MGRVLCALGPVWADKPCVSKGTRAGANFQDNGWYGFVRAEVAVQPRRRGLLHCLELGGELRHGFEISHAAPCEVAAHIGKDEVPAASVHEFLGLRGNLAG